MAQELIQLQRDHARVQDELAAALVNVAAAATQQRSNIVVFRHWQQRALDAEAQVERAADARVNRAAAALAVVAEAAEVVEAAEDNGSPRAQGQAILIDIDSDGSETDGSDDEDEDEHEDGNRMVFHEGALTTHVE